MSTGVLGLLIFSICIIFFVWDRIPAATMALLGCAFMVLLGVSKFNTAFGQIASSTVVLLVGVMIIGGAFVETGLANIIGRLVTRLTNNSERKIIFVSFLIAYAMSTFLTNVTVLAIFIPVIFAISATEKKIKPMNIVIPLTLAVNAGGITTLVGSSQQMTAQGLLEEYGYVGFKVFDLTPMGVILGVAFLVYSLTLGYYLGNRIWGDRKESEINAEVSAPAAVELHKGKIVAISIIFVCMVILYIYQRIPFTTLTVKPVITAVLASLACIVTGCISQSKAIASVKWNVVGRLAGCLGLAAALSEAGSIDLVSNWFLSLAGEGFSPVLFYVIVVLFTWVASLFVSNSTAISITMLLVMSIAPALNLNVHTFAMAIIFVSSIGCCCPLSGSTWGVAMTAGYRFKDFFRYGIVIDLIGVVLTMVCVPLLFGGFVV